MSTRSTLRRKVVLPVTVIRNNGTQRQLAHTLDATASSARLGGLYIAIEPGEVIEIQRGVARAKFHVFWVGAPGSPLSGQAGMRLVAGRSIWGGDFPADEPDIGANAQQFRSGHSMVRSTGVVTASQDQSSLQCKGGASVRTATCDYAVFAQITDISEESVHLQTMTAFPVNTEVHVKLNVQGFQLEMPGAVRSSEPLIGMGVEFHKTTPANYQKLKLALQTLKQSAGELIKDTINDKGSPMVLRLAL